MLCGYNGEETLSGLKITGMDVKSFTMPYTQPIGSSLGTYAGAGWTLVLLHTADGPTGVGFTMSLDTKGAAAVHTCIEDDLAPLAAGRDALAPESLWHALWAPMKPRMRGGIGMHALSAVDIACWDIVAKTAGLPLNRLLGGYRQTVPVYGSGGWVTLDDSALVAECQAFAEQGIAAYKLKIGTPRDAERVALLRREMGDDFTLLVDANQNYNVREAIEVSRRLAEYGVAWLEEPVIADSVDDLAETARHSAIPIAAGENAYLRWGFREICERRAVAFLQPDVVRCGGVTEWMKVAHLADAYNISLTSHLVHELHVSLVGASPSGHLVEYVNLFGNDLFTREFAVEDGHLRVPEVPGHGVEFNMDTVRRLES